MSTSTVSPVSGRLCRRSLSQGQALVGVLTLPADFTVEPGRSYLLVDTGTSFRLAELPFEDPLSDENIHYGIDGLLRSTVWRGVTAPEAMTVKFLDAFPQDNTWVVFGASNVPLPKDAPSHAWWDIGPKGQRTPIEAPVDAVGQTMGQLLSFYPLWPDARGELYALPKLYPATRELYQRFHELLVASTKDPDLDATLEASIARQPEFHILSMGRVDRDFCRYLAALDAIGGMTLDRPRNADELRAYEALHDQAMAKYQEKDEAEDGLVASAPRRAPKP